MGTHRPLLFWHPPVVHSDRRRLSYTDLFPRPTAHRAARALLAAAPPSLLAAVGRAAADRRLAPPPPHRLASTTATTPATPPRTLTRPSVCPSPAPVRRRPSQRRRRSAVRVWRLPRRRSLPRGAAPRFGLSRCARLVAFFFFLRVGWCVRDRAHARTHARTHARAYVRSHARRRTHLHPRAAAAAAFVWRAASPAVCLTPPPPPRTMDLSRL